MALQRPDPAFLRDDDGDRLALYHGLENVLVGMFRGLAEGRPTAAEIGVWAKGLLDLADLVGDRCPLPILGLQQGLQLLLLLGQPLMLGPDLHLLQLAEAAEAHVE